MLKSNKRAVSTIIAYVLLIGLAVSMSILVHNWLKLYVAEDESQVCPDAVYLSIEDYSCSWNSNQLNLTLKNRGNFIIEDVSVKTSEDSESIGIDGIFLDYSVEISVGESKNLTYSIDGLNYGHDNNISIEVQPVIFDDGEIIYCSQTINQDIFCKYNPVEVN